MGAFLAGWGLFCGSLRANFHVHDARAHLWVTQGCFSGVRREGLASSSTPVFLDYFSLLFMFLGCLLQVLYA